LPVSAIDNIPVGFHVHHNKSRNLNISDKRIRISVRPVTNRMGICN